MNKRLPIGLLVLMVLAITAGCQNSSDLEAESPPVAVEVAVVELGEVHTKAVLSGQARARIEMPVLSKLPLQVTGIAVKVGDRVQAGQLLVQLDDKDLREQVRQAEAGLRVAQAALPSRDVESPAAASARLAYESAASDLERMEYLHGEGLLADQTLEQAKVRVAGARAQYQGVLDQEKMAFAGEEQAAAALQLARSQLSNTAVSAPVAGLVSALSAEVGDMANPAMPLAHIVDMGEIKIELRAGEQVIRHLAEGQEVQVSIASLGRKFPGRLTVVSPAADLQTRAFLLEVTVDNDDLSIKPGMFAEVEFSTETVSDVPVIARSAVLLEGDRQIVYVVKDDRAKMQEVQLGLVNDDVAEIVAGLRPGDPVVVKGQQYLSADLPVTVLPGGDK